MNINLFDFELPEELIAQMPSEKRDHSRLLVIDKNAQKYEDLMVAKLLEIIQEASKAAV